MLTQRRIKCASQITFVVVGDGGSGQNKEEGFSVVLEEKFCVAAVHDVVVLVVLGDRRRGRRKRAHIGRVQVKSEE